MDELESRGVSYEFFNGVTHLLGIDNYMDIEVAHRDKELLLAARAKVEK